MWWRYGRTPCVVVVHDRAVRSNGRCYRVVTVASSMVRPVPTVVRTMVSAGACAVIASVSAGTMVVTPGTVVVAVTVAARACALVVVAVVGCSVWTVVPGISVVIWAGGLTVVLVAVVLVAVVFVAAGTVVSAIECP